VQDSPTGERKPVASVVQTSAWPAIDELARQFLSPAEQARAAAFRDPVDQVDYCAAHVLVRLLAATIAGTPPSALELEQRCEHCGGPHGRPFFGGHPGLYASLSHTRGAVLAAAGSSPLGADIESLRSQRVEARLIETVLSTAEQERLQRQSDQHASFLRQWVRKEAMVKLGLGSLGSLRQIGFGDLTAPDESDSAPVCIALAPAWPGLYLMEQLDRQAGLVFAVVSAEPVTLLPLQEVSLTAI
jgi:4'-phosphopantetheinyl transferase